MASLLICLLIYWAMYMPLHHRSTMFAQMQCTLFVHILFWFLSSTILYRSKFSVNGDKRHDWAFPNMLRKTAGFVYGHADEGRRNGAASGELLSLTSTNTVLWPQGDGVGCCCGNVVHCSTSSIINTESGGILWRCEHIRQNLPLPFLTVWIFQTKMLWISLCYVFFFAYSPLDRRDIKALTALFLYPSWKIEARKVNSNCLFLLFFNRHSITLLCERTRLGFFLFCFVLTLLSLSVPAVVMPGHSRHPALFFISSILFNMTPHPISFFKANTYVHHTCLSGGSSRSGKIFAPGDTLLRLKWF